MQKQNFHTHSRFSDGRDTPRELIEEALERGFYAIGFSDHSWFPATDGANDYTMTEAETPRCFREIESLSRDYAGRIRVWNGLELDRESPPPALPYDYIIAAVHGITRRGRYLAIDYTPEEEVRLVTEFFGGDWESFGEAYYDALTDHVLRRGADIVAHLDLPVKYGLFPEESARVRDAASSAVRAIVKECDLFELNTGVIVRSSRTVPYPSRFLLGEIRAAGGRVIVDSDCHDRRHLTCWFDEAEEYLSSAGFTRNDRARLNGRIDGVTIWE